MHKERNKAVHSFRYICTCFLNLELLMHRLDPCVNSRPFSTLWWDRRQFKQVYLVKQKLSMAGGKNFLLLLYWMAPKFILKLIHLCKDGMRYPFLVCEVTRLRDTNKNQSRYQIWGILSTYNTINIKIKSNQIKYVLACLSSTFSRKRKYWLRIIV